MSRSPTTETRSEIADALGGPVVADLAEFARTDSATNAAAPTSQRFTFTYLGTPCTAHIAHEPAISRLVVEAHLGFVPYSIDSRTRRRLTRIVLQASRVLRHSRWRVVPTQCIRMEVAAQLTRPLTPAALLFEPLRAFIEARPFIEILREVALPPARKIA